MAKKNMTPQHASRKKATPRQTSTKSGTIENATKPTGEQPCADITEIVEAPKYKEDLDAFSGLVEEGRDFISALPSETLDQVLSYCILDHEPDLAVRTQAEGIGFVQRPHVLLSLAAMSRHLRAHVEDFSRRHQIKHKDAYRFKTNDELEASREEKKIRRSSRLKEKTVMQDLRVYRVELVRRLKTYCIDCSNLQFRPATMVNGVSCCEPCERKCFPEQISLTEALKEYDLRDWMLIPSRKPGPRMKKVKLITIPYGTVLSNTPIMYGKRCTSFRFFRKDVEAIARTIHGDVKAHVQKKEEQRRRKVHQRLKIRKHGDALDRKPDGSNREYHQMRLDHFQDPDWDDGDDSDVSIMSGYGNYGDIHERFCDKFKCRRCLSEKRTKYNEWWRDVVAFDMDYDSEYDMDDWY